MLQGSSYRDVLYMDSITAANQIERIVKLTHELFQCPARIDLWSDPAQPEISYVKFIVPGTDPQQDLQLRKKWHRGLFEFIPDEANNFSLDIEYH
jgi:hypothetical protein